MTYSGAVGAAAPQPQGRHDMTAAIIITFLLTMLAIVWLPTEELR